MRLSLRSALTAVLLFPLIVGCTDDDLEKSRKENEEVVKQKESEEKKKNSDKEEEQEKEKPETPKEKENEKGKEDDKQKEGTKDEPKKEEEQEKEKPETPKEKEDETKPEKEKESEDKPKEDDNDEVVYAEPAKRSPMFMLEFTGQYCINCPVVMRNLAKEQEKYGKENYIYVAMHSEKKFSILGKPLRSLYNEEADQYGKDVKKISGLPFTWLNSLGVTNEDKTLREFQNSADLLDCKANASLSEQGKVKLNFKTYLRKDRKEYIKGKQIRMLVWLLEDGVEALQYGYNTKSYWKKIINNHLFRSSLNGHWGELYQVGTRYEKTFDLPENVLKGANCEIILLFLDDSNKFVLDAKRCKVK